MTKRELGHEKVWLAWLVKLWERNAKDSYVIMDREQAMIELAKSFVSEIVALEEIVDSKFTQSDAQKAMEMMRALKDRFESVAKSLRTINDPIATEENLPYTLARARAQLTVKVNSLNRNTARNWSDNLYCAKLEMEEDFLKYCENE